MGLAMILIVLLPCCPLLNGQISISQQEISYPAEEIRVHLSQTCLFPGEVMAFKIYCTNELFPALEISRLAFIELVSDRNASVLRKKILLEEGTGGGEFVLPDDMPTGIYTVVTYTNWLKNFGEDFFDRQHIMILNPDDVSVTDTCEAETDDLSCQQGSEGSHTGMTLQTDKEYYRTREKVTLKIVAGREGQSPAGGCFSISAYRTEPAFYKSKYSVLNERKGIKAEEIRFLPDFNGIRLSGKLEKAGGSAIANSTVILSEPGPGTKIKHAGSDEKGNFHFLLSARGGEMDLVFTLPDEKTFLKLEEPFWNGLRNQAPHRTFCLNNQLLGFMVEKYDHYQLSKKFNLSTFSMHEQVTRNPEDSGRFYHNQSLLIRMDDYIILDSLPEYFYELVPSVRYMHNRGDRTIRIVDPITGNMHKESPGVFVDGVLYSDYLEMARIPVQEIHDIAILPELYYYHDFTFGGIIDLHTRNADFSSVPLLPNMTRLIYPLASPQQTEFNRKAYPDTTISDRIPDFRYLICWEPDIHLVDTAASTIYFYTGDVVGEFTVKLCGISSDGMIKEAQCRIFVQNPGTRP